MNPKTLNNRIDPTNLLLIIYLAIMLTIILSSCNPVKQVLRDKQKLDQVAEVVIKSGYCINDTTIVSKSDTLLQFDTITNTETEIVVKNDTLLITKVKQNYVTKTVKIRDTVRQVVADNARINILEADKVKLAVQLEEKKAESRNRMNWLVVLILIIVGYIYFKIRK